jgi:ABC-2 type transport system ATP-binding protein
MMNSTPSHTGIDIQNVSKHYNTLMALKSVSLSVNPAERFGLIGPDGAGKTSLMRILCGLVNPTSGIFYLAGFSGKTELHRIKNVIGYMPQRFSLYPDLTVSENIRFFADLFGAKGVDLKHREERLMRFSRLESFRNRKAGSLSGGMKQKLALSCALIHTPRVLILDEPTTGVDPLSRREFWDILSELGERDGTTILVSTPYMDEAEQCHRVAFMSHGQILAINSPDNLVRDYPHTVLILRGDSLFRFRGIVAGLPGVASVCALGDHLRVSLADPINTRKHLESFLRDHELNGVVIESGEPILEDVFVRFLEKGDERDPAV